MPSIHNVGAAAQRPATAKAVSGWTAEERTAMKARTQELKAEARADKDKAAGERAVLAAIAEMPEPDRAASSPAPACACRR